MQYPRLLELNKEFIVEEVTDTLIFTSNPRVEEAEVTNPKNNNR